MSVLELVREPLRGFSGYSSARLEASGGAVLLNANESPWPAASDPEGRLNRYPDPQPSALRIALAALYGVEAGQVLATRGSDEGIDLLVRAVCRAGRDGVLFCPPTFGMYAVAATVQEAHLLRCPLIERGSRFELDAGAVIRTAARDGARIVFLCSPNNPTATATAAEALARVAAGLEGQALVVVDEAYAEFAGGASAATLLAGHSNLVVLRTLSKAHALAGARIGAVLAAPELIGVLRAIMAPYPLAAPCVDAALAALAPAALAATGERVRRLLAERARLARALAQLPGVRRVFDSDANFLLVRFDRAREVYQRALAAGIVLRDVGRQPPLDGCLRISVGTPEENQRLLDLLRERVPA